MKELSKEHIKDRLLKRAARQWGYSDIELENVFDPIVNLLFDVCAKELEKIAGEIYSSRRRMTERLVDILTPTAATKAAPARGILRAYPAENEVILSDHHQFYYQRKETNPYNPTESNIKNYFFGPTAPVKLTRNKLQYVVLPSGVQEVVKEQFRESVAGDKYLKPSPHGSMWLGIKHEGSGIIKDLMFYFFLKNIDNRNVFFHFLPKAKWYIGNHLLQTEQGYNTNEDLGTLKGGLINDSFYHIEKMQEQVNDFYRKQFITIKDIMSIDAGDFALPEEFSSFVDAENLKELDNQKLLWIKIEFPNVINNEILSQVYSAVNCFPAINKRLNETQGSIKSLLNIYPLSTNEEYFLEVLSASDDKNNDIDIMDAIDDSANDNDLDHAYLRFGGIARFDERNAGEEINYLIDLVRDEAAAFSRLGHDFTDGNLKEINQIISRFKNKMSQLGMQDTSNPYLVFRSKDPDKKGTLFVKYWTTNGEAANKINTFSRLALHKGADFEKDSIMFLSTTQGGKNELSNSEKIYAYRENLISNQRVVTRQDIIILCKNHYGESVGTIEIKNGIQTSLEENVGYTPTIDIHLHRKDTETYTDEEWYYLSENLKLSIEKRALDIVPFRIFYN